MIDDPEIRELAAQQRKQHLKRLGVVAAVVLVAVVAVVPSGGSVASALDADGYENVNVSRKGVFSFTDEANKNGADCTGRYTLLPGSSSQSGLCFEKRD